MSKETSNNFLNILFLFFLALVIAYPVSVFIKNRRDLSKAITPQQRQAFISDEVFSQNAQSNLINLEPGARIGEGYKSVSYANDGSAIIRVTINNVANLTKEEFALVGSTPFSLLNSVRANIKTPQVLDVVFNDDIIVNAFFARETTQNLINNPQVLVDMVSRNDKEVSDFINHPAVQEALNSKEVLNVLAGSQMFANLLASPTGKFFLTNPDEVKRLINQNQDLKALSENENLRYLLLNFAPTKTPAQIALN
ncbi:MAG: hypothetical protein II972_02000 [Elusimicrobiaceae bacterium]|nr:hypothetical protein [Elusimicrobiaceae bacterium]MBQ6224201.1 hypothetical protein [Campylobacter sp.]